MIYAQKEGQQEELYAGYLAGFGPVFYDTLFILKYDNPNILLRLSPFLCLALAVAGRGGFESRPVNPRFTGQKNLKEKICF